MKIVVKQKKANFNNEFEVFVNNNKEYFATTPVLNMQGSILKFDKMLPIKINDINGNTILESSYSVVDNLKEEIIPLKYIVTKEQKFDQFSFKDSNNNIKCSMFFSQQAFFKGDYVLCQDGKFFVAYSKSTGYYNNIAIYDGDVQIGEIVKLNVIRDGLDEYTIFLKDEYSSFVECFISFTLYIDRTCFNYGFMKNVDYINYSKTFSENDNKFNPNWIKENFDATEFYNECEKNISDAKQRVKKKVSNILIAIVCCFVGIGGFVLILLKVLGII